MIKQHRFKIALVGEMLSRGGAERVQAGLSFFFEEKGIEVHHIIVQDVVTYEYAGTLFNMGKLKDDSNGISNKWYRFQALKNYLKKQQFDFIIDFRVKNKFLQEYYIANFLYTSPYVMSIRSFDTRYYFPKNNYLAGAIYKNAYGIITVSKALEEKIKSTYDYKNVKTIYNPVRLESISAAATAFKPFDFPYILGMGRMHPVKQFDHMIHAFSRTSAIEKGYKLILMGDGDSKSDLQDLVQKKGMENNVVFLSYQENPFPYFSNAFLTVLTSINEGFPNVLIESLACGTPVVAYDCESGPGEIIEHKENGLLVENQNLDEMTRAIETLIHDKQLYDNLASNAVNSVEKFNFESIGMQWLDYLKIPVNNEL